ncbi:elongation factor 1-gamma (EF-1-gamma) [Trypanosoma cruzi]|nr:elongation factor 1-gamma (EF-1-gamma) [Trypanosoma cruzi]
MTVAVLLAHIHTHFPVSLSVLDDLKIDYSHTDTRTVAAPYFFQHCDAAGHTTLWCNKYNKDDKMQCMTANPDPRVVAAHGARGPVCVGRCTHDCGGEAARHCGAVCVARPGHAGDCEGCGGHGAV